MHVSVEGMVCGACTGAVERATGSLPGVASVNVELGPPGQATYTFKSSDGPPTSQQIAQIVDAIEEAGFDATANTDPTPATNGTAAPPVPPPPPPPDKDYVRYVDAASGNYYYSCSITQLTTWDEPPSWRDGVAVGGDTSAATSTEGSGESSTASSSVVVVKVDGMFCGACTASVTKATSELAGVASANVVLEPVGYASYTVVEGASAKDVGAAAAAAIDAIGFDAEVLSPAKGAELLKQAEAGAAAAAPGSNYGGSTSAATTTTTTPGTSANASSITASGFSNFGRSDVVKMHVATMYSRSCQRWVEDALDAIGTAAIAKHQVNLIESSVQITFQPSSSGHSAAIRSVKTALATSGYTAMLWDDYVNVGRSSVAPQAPRDDDHLPARVPSPYASTSYGSSASPGAVQQKSGGAGNGSSGGPTPSSCVAALAVGGMSCAACSSRVELVLRKLKGVEDVSVNFLTGRTTVRYSPLAMNSGGGNNSQAMEAGNGGGGEVARIVKAIVNAGYSALPVGGGGGEGGGSGVVASCDLEVRGMVCEADPVRIAQVLKNIDGVFTCDSNWPTSNTLKVTWDAELDGVGVRTFMSVMQGAGYEATVPAGTAQSDLLDAAQAANTAALKRSFLISFALTLPLFIMTMGLMHWDLAMKPLRTNLLDVSSDDMATDENGGPNERGGTLRLDLFIQFVLCTPVQLGVGAQFYRRAWAALKHGSSNMDVLIAIGTSVRRCAALN